MKEYLSYFFQTAESIADLIDGYCRLLTNDLEFTIWQRETNVKNDKSTAKTSNTFPDEPSTPNKGKPILTDDYAEIGLLEGEGDYSTPTGKLCYYFNIHSCSNFLFSA